MKQKKWISLGLWAVFSLCMVYAGFFIARHEHLLLFGTFGIAFLAGSLLSLRGLSLKYILLAGMVSRLLLLPALPQLSDDYHRFFWDGTLVLHQVHPYQHTPTDLLKEGVMEEESLSKTYPKLNSPDYYSVYPPGHQMLFAGVAALAGDHILQFVIFLRMALLLFECGTLLLMGFLLQRWRKPMVWLGLYAFNPLVILEIVGNLHFEGMMVFFILLAMALYEVKKPWLSASAMGLAVATKLLPLISLPAWFFWLKPAQKWSYSGIALLVSCILFLPLFDWQVFLHLFQSLDLYFRNFEFNPSLYALVRALGFALTGYNQIALIGPLLGFLSGLFILVVAYRRRKKCFPASLAYLWLIYLAFSTTVHPWYIIPALAFGLLGGLWFPWVWSAVVMLSYLQYGENMVEQKPLLWMIEYTLVGMALLVDLRNEKPLFHGR